MFKSLLSLFSISLIAVVFFATTKMYAEAPAGTFGINAEFGSGSNEAGLSYVVSRNIEIGFGLTFMNESYSVDAPATAADAQTTLGFSLFADYYLSKGDINPYIGINLNYLGYPEVKQSETNKTNTNDMGFELVFGAQSFITKSFAVYAEMGVGYSMHNITQTSGSKDFKSSTNMLKLFTSAIGATFYFN
jgi:hypothetical protein